MAETAVRVPRAPGNIAYVALSSFGSEAVVKSLMSI
jgi:hypothetical protein